MSRQSSRNGMRTLPALRYDGDVISPRDLEQYRPVQDNEPIDRAYQIKDEIIASLNAARGSWQLEAQSRHLLQEHVRTITEIVRKLSHDIQILEAQIKDRDSATAGTQNVVKNLEMHHVAGVTDLRSRVVRCDAAIARLSSDVKTAFESIQTLALRQQEHNAQINDKLHKLDTKIHELTSSVDRRHTEHSMQLQHVESGTSHQVSGLDTRTRAVVEELKATIQALRVAEHAERDKLEARLLTHVEHVLTQREARLEKMEQRRDEMMAEQNRNISRLQEELHKEKDKNRSFQQHIETRLVSSIDASIQKHGDELSRLRRELRGGLETVHESISEMKEVVETRRLLMEEQMRKEISQVRKMVVLV